MEIKLICQLLLILINLPFLISQNNKKEFNYILGDNDNKGGIMSIEPRQFISGNIIDENVNYYKIKLLLNDIDKIYFDYQSEFGCLYISFNEKIINNTSKYDFKFCSEGFNQILELKKIDIMNKIDKKKIDDITIYIGVGHNKSEINKKEYNYSIKVSFSKPNINIFEINSDHKILCKTEKFNETNRCLFAIVYKNSDNDIGNSKEKNLIVYPISQTKNAKLKIYSSFMNKEYYDKWNTDYLINNIPNIKSPFTNNGLQQEFLFINVTNEDKYIYICIESNKETIIEMHSHYLYKNQDIKLPKINEIQFYNIPQNQNKISFDFSPLKNNDNNLNKDIFISLVSLNGKASVFFENSKSMKIVTDAKENELVLNINNYNINYKLIINNLEYIQKKNKNKNNYNLGYIFYIKLWTINNKNIMNEFDFSKSYKLSYDNIKLPIILYSQIPNINSSININLHFYNISNLDTSIINDDILNIEILILSSDEIYKLKKGDSSFISNINPIKGKFNYNLFVSNIYLSIEDMKKFKDKENPWIYIRISGKNDLQLKKLILGSTISQVNSLIYPSERIYHFGKIHNEKKVVYKLAGNKKFHLMRIEIGFNSNLINYSVKRTNSENNYMQNDTDLSFIKESSYNGRGLLTIFINNGEDIYLTIFNKNINNKLTNYVFKYINAEKNADFKNYYIIDDNLSFNEKDSSISISKINNLPASCIVDCSVKIIEKGNYIENEKIKTIAITQSIGNSNIKGTIQNDLVKFHINYGKDKKNFYSNAYCKIIGENYDVDYLSYNGLIFGNINEFEPKSKYNKTTMYIIIISASGFIILVIILSVFCWYMNKLNRRKKHITQLVNTISFANGDDYDDDYDDLLE